LKYGIGLAFVGGQGQHVVPVKGQRTAVRLFKTGYNPKQGGFSATGRSQQGKELTLIYSKAHIIENPEITEGLVNPFDENIASFQLLTSSLPSVIDPGTRPNYKKTMGFF
jgi:hypothetical protein